MKKTLTGLVVIAIVAFFAGFAWSEEAERVGSLQDSETVIVVALNDVAQEGNTPSEEEIVEEETPEDENPGEEMPEDENPDEGDSEEEAPEEGDRKE